MFTKRIFFGVILTWTLLEGARGLWKVWARQREGSGGMLGGLADDVLEVVD